MPRLSAFTRCGNLRLSSAMPKGQQIYESMARSLGGTENFDDDFDGPNGAMLYAIAMNLATIHWTLVRAAGNATPETTTELIAKQELDWGVAPLSSDTMLERRTRLRSARSIFDSTTESAVYSALLAEVGDSLKAVVASDDTTVVPVDPTTGPGNWVDADSAIAVWRLTEFVDAGVQTVGVEWLAGSTSPLTPNQSITVDPGSLGLQENARITASTSTTITATFAHGHGAGSQVIVGAFPYWLGWRRHWWIAVSTAAALDAQIRGRIDILLHRMLRATSTWDIVQEDGTHTAGPFKIGEGKIGITPIQAVSW